MRERGRFVRDRSPRPLGRLIALAFVSAAMLMAVHTPMGPAPAVGQHGIRGPLGPAALRDGRDALERGEWAIADDAFRVAWLDPQTRADAAQELWDLHRTAGFSIRAEEASVSAALEQLGPRFRRFETPHFVVVSDAAPAWITARARLMERTREQFYRAAARLEVHAIPHRHRLLIVVFNDDAAFRAFARASDQVEADWVAGYFSLRGNRVVLFNPAGSAEFVHAGRELDAAEQHARDARRRAREADRDRNDRLATGLRAAAGKREADVRRYRDDLQRQADELFDTKIMHEVAHLLAFNSGVQRRDRNYPFWFSEGLAMTFETDDPGRPFGPDRVGSLSLERRQRFGELHAQGGLLPVAKLVTLPEVPEWREDAADAMYAGSFALFTHLYRRDPAALGRYLRALESFEPGEATPDTMARVFAQHLGDPIALDRTLRRAASVSTAAAADNP